MRFIPLNILRSYRSFLRDFHRSMINTSSKLPIRRTSNWRKTQRDCGDWKKKKRCTDAIVHATMDAKRLVIRSRKEERRETSRWRARGPFIKCKLFTEFNVRLTSKLLWTNKVLNTRDDPYRCSNSYETRWTFTRWIYRGPAALSGSSMRRPTTAGHCNHETTAWRTRLSIRLRFFLYVFDRDAA